MFFFHLFRPFEGTKQSEQNIDNNNVIVFDDKNDYQNDQNCNSKYDEIKIIKTAEPELKKNHSK